MTRVISSGCHVGSPRAPGPTENKDKTQLLFYPLISLSSSSSSSSSSALENRKSMEIATLNRNFHESKPNFSAERISLMIADLESSKADLQRRAAAEIRLLARFDPENRLKIAQSGALKPLISLISSPDPQIQEQSVTAVLNLSLRDEIRRKIVDSGAVGPLIAALKTGTEIAKENAACALLYLSRIDGQDVEIGRRTEAIPALINLLRTGTLQGKKDAAAALYSLCSATENKIRAVEEGIVRPLVGLIADAESGMVDKAVVLLGSVVAFYEAAAAVVAEGGVGVLVEVLDTGTAMQKEVAAAVLLQICEESVVYRPMVGREGAIPPLVALSQSGTANGRKKAETLIRLLRLAREQHINSSRCGEINRLVLG